MNAEFIVVLYRSNEIVAVIPLCVLPGVDWRLRFGDASGVATPAAASSPRRRWRRWGHHHHHVVDVALGHLVPHVEADAPQVLRGDVPFLAVDRAPPPLVDVALPRRRLAAAVAADLAAVGAQRRVREDPINSEP